MKKRISTKASIELSTETIIKIALTVIILLALWGLTVKLVKIFIPEKDEATKRNFDMLVATITGLEDGSSFASYPLYLNDDVTIVGYPSGSSGIQGSCKLYDLESYSNKKPEQCGSGDQGCICLCKKEASLCLTNENVISCVGVDQFKEDISFTGGTFADGSGFCDFAMIVGTDAIQNIYLKRSMNTVRICTKECSIITTGAVTPGPCLSKEKIQEILKNADSPLASYADTILADAQKYNIKPEVFLAFSRKEANYAKEGTIANQGMNPGNLRQGGCKDCAWYCDTTLSTGFCKYNSWEQGIEAWFALIKGAYVDEGRDTVETIISKYCPPSDCGGETGTQQYVDQLYSSVENYGCDLKADNGKVTIQGAST